MYKANKAAAFSARKFQGPAVRAPWPATRDIAVHIMKGA